MITLQRGSWPRLYSDLVHRAAEEGYTRPSRDGETIDLGPALLACPAPTFGVISGRGGSAEFARLEQLGYLAGVGSDHLLAAAPSYERFRDPVYGWWGAYGLRLKRQLPLVVEELSKRNFSRRGVALIWDAGTMEIGLGYNPRDVPCTLGLSFWIGPAGELRCQAFMRSTDLWLGLYYDMPAFAFLQRAVAKALSRGVGQTYLTTSSLHMYTRDADKAAGVLPRYIDDLLLVHAALPDPVLPRNASAMKRWAWLVDWANAQINAQDRLNVITGVVSDE